MGDSEASIITKVAQHIIRPQESAQIGLALAARLGTTDTGIIDGRGWRGIVCFARVTAVAGAGNCTLSVRGSIDGNNWIQMGTTAALTGNGGLMVGNGALATASGNNWTVANCLFPRYVMLRGANASAVPGNEATFELTYMFIR